MALNKQKTGQKTIHLAIGLAIMFLGGLIAPTWGPVTRLGVQAIAIFTGMIYLSLTGFTFVFTAVAAMFAMHLTGFFTSSEIIAKSWGGSTIYQLIVVYALCQGIVECGAGSVLARYLISRKWAQGKPLVFTFMLLMASIFAGAFLGLGGVVFYYSILEEIRKQLDYAPDCDWMKFNVFGVYIAACVGMTLIPYKGIPLIVFGSLNAMLAQYGYEISYVSYMLGIAIFGILSSAVYCLMMRYVFRVDMDRLRSFDIRNLEGMRDIRLDKRQTIACIVFALAIAYGVVIVFLPKGAAITSVIKGISQTTWFALCLAALCVLQVDGQPVFNPRSVLKNGVNWEILFSIGGFSLIGIILSAPDAGIQEWLQSSLGGVLNGMGFPGFMLVIILFTLVLTNVMSNTAIGMIASAIAVPFVAGYAANQGINITMFVAGMMMADMYAFATPAASGSAPILHGHDSIKADKRFIYTKGLAVCLVHIVLAWLLFTAAAYIL